MSQNKYTSIANNYITAVEEALAGILRCSMQGFYERRGIEEMTKFDNVS